MAALPNTPIIQVGTALIVSMQDDLTDRDVLDLQEHLTNRITKSRAKGVLLDVSAVGIIDSFTGRVLADLASMARLLDADTVVVGIQPAVALTLVELGLELKEVHTALDVDQGMEWLEDRRAIR